MSFGALFTTHRNKKYNVTLLLRDAYRTDFEETLNTLANLSFDPGDFKTLIPRISALQHLVVKADEMATLFEDVHATIQHNATDNERDIWDTAGWRPKTIRHQNEDLSYQFLRDLMLQVMRSDYFEALALVSYETKKYMKERSNLPYSEESLRSADKLKKIFELQIIRTQLKGKRLNFEYDNIESYDSHSPTYVNFNLIQFGSKEGLFSCMMWKNTRLARHVLQWFLDNISYDLHNPNEHANSPRKIVLHKYQVPAIHKRLTSLEQVLNRLLIKMLRNAQTPLGTAEHMITEAHNAMSLQTEVDCKNEYSEHIFRISFAQARLILFDKAAQDLSYGLSFLVKGIDTLDEWIGPRSGPVIPQGKGDQMVIRNMLKQVRELLELVNNNINKRKQDDEDVQLVNAEEQKKLLEAAIDLDLENPKPLPHIKKENSKRRVVVDLVDDAEKCARREAIEKRAKQDPINLDGDDDDLVIGIETEEERLEAERAKAADEGRFYDLTSDFVWRPPLHKRIKKEPSA